MNSSHNSPVLEDEEHSEIGVIITSVADISDEDIFFAKERYKLHQFTPDEGVDITILKNYFFKKYGF